MRQRQKTEVEEELRREISNRRAYFERETTALKRSHESAIDIIRVKRDQYNEENNVLKSDNERYQEQIVMLKRQSGGLEMQLRDLQVSGQSVETKESLGSDDENKTILWWWFLSSIALCNICMWLWTCKLFTTNELRGNADDHPYQKSQLILSGIYVFVCAYRSVLPRIDLERYCLFDTWWSSIFLGRAAATIAEISFSAQVALFLFHLGDLHDHGNTKSLAVAIVPVIAIAQMFCWCGVLTLNHVYHAVEESIWAASSALVGISLASFVIWHPDNEALYKLAVTASIVSALFFAFMVTVDVPMYLERWRNGKKIGGNVMKPDCADCDAGRADAWNRRVVTKSWKVWKGETMWLTGYFSSAVWLSLLLVHMPAP